MENFHYLEEGLEVEVTMERVEENMGEIGKEITHLDSL